MKKLFYRTTIILILIVLSSLVYLSTIGIKTKRFNSTIISQLKKAEPNIELKINYVSAKLNLLNLSIDAKTIGTDVIYRNKIIKLENLKSKISLKSIFENKFAISEISISTKSLPLKDLIGFIRLINNNTKLLILEQVVSKGYIVADFKLEFDNIGRLKKNYKINGLVNDTQITVLKKKVDKLNFVFEISDQRLIFNQIDFLINNKKIFVEKLIALKQDNNFLVSGRFNTKNLYLKKGDLIFLKKNDFIEKNFREVNFSSDNTFNFRINDNLNFKNFNMKSIIDMNYLKLNNFLEIKNVFPKIKKDIIFENQKIKLEYTKDRLEINGNGSVVLQDEKDIINYKIIDNKKEINFDLGLKISKNKFIFDLLNYEKEKKNLLNLSIKGKQNKSEILLKEILLTENKNTFSIENLNLSNDLKINNIEIININFIDKENFNNNLQIKKDGKRYKVSGSSFNLNKIISELLESKVSKKKKIFNNNFDVFFDIKKIYLDKKNICRNFKGYLSINRNEIRELNLESFFYNNEKIRLTVNTSENEEKIITLFSEQAKPLVDRYKFVKGFNEGKLDFYSITKNKETQSTIKIYDFKLKEVPALTKLLTLASLQGIADLLSGEGIRFTEFEMKFTNIGKLMKIDEIYAIGPAISILMEGYIEKNKLVSLRGTLVPATTINKTISSIPLLGGILVGKKVGEGVFGVSFKIKGPPNNLETTVNPIKTLTPRFITRTLEKIKKTN